MLYLYQNVVPNYDDGIHYYFEDFSKYKTLLSSHLFTTLTPNDYRINTEVCKIGFDNVFNALNAQSITYIIDERENYVRCYYIRRYDIQSNMIILNLEMDYWGSFIASCSLNDIWIKRCNRRLETPVYDDSLTYGNPTFEYMPISGITFPPNDELVSGIKANEYFTNNTLCIVLAVTYNTHEQNNASVTETRLFGQALQNELSLSDVMNTYGGLYAYNDNGTDRLATITGAWLVDSCGIPAQGGIDYTGTSKDFKFKKDDGTTATKRLYMINIFNNVERIYTYDVSDPDYKYHFGTYNNNMLLKPYGGLTLKIRYVLSNDHINVIACNGDKQEDITSAFAISLSSTNGELRESRLLVQQLQNGLKIASGTIAVGANLQAGQYAQGAQGMLGVSSDVLGMLDKQSNANCIGHVVKGGDGYSTFNNKSSSYGAFKNPIVMLKYKTLQYGKDHVRRYGANFNYYYGNGSLFDIRNKNYLVGSTSYTYIMANVDVEQAPIEACDTIKQIFARGVRIDFIT